jgi:antirestriction protein ArdC
MKTAELQGKIKDLVSKLANETDAARQSELFKDFLRVAGMFHNYSWGNQLLIWSHRPNATRVAGFRTWQKLNRFVKKGEKGIPIFAPMCFKDKRPADADGIVTEERMRLWFKVVYVFDVSQTDGEPLPALPQTCAGDPGRLETALLTLAEDRGIKVEFGSTGDAQGYAEKDGSHVVISSKLNPAGRAAVLVHELSHCLLHFDKERRVNLKQRELEAEAVAFVVGTHYGLEMPSNFYLASYGVKASDLLESLPVVQKTAAEIIGAVEADGRKPIANMETTEAADLAAVATAA